MGFGGNESVRGEARWHGVCLALAELARRGLLKGEEVRRAVEWVVKVSRFRDAFRMRGGHADPRLSLSISAELLSPSARMCEMLQRTSSGRSHAHALKLSSHL
jgi:hypothetical protein